MARAFAELGTRGGDDDLSPRWARSRPSPPATPVGSSAPAGIGGGRAADGRQPGAATQQVQRWIVARRVNGSGIVR